MDYLELTINVLLNRIRALLENDALPPHRRILIALAGVPGSGKSTISSALMEALKRKEKSSASLVPMDGYHYSKAELSNFSDSEFAFRRRGAPFTFDAEGVIELIELLRAAPVTLCDDPAAGWWVPSFDHAVQDPVKDAIHISSSDRIVILEGNYLLFDEQPWNKIVSLVDDKWFIDVAPETARERLIKRHLLAGIENTVAAAGARVEENDMINAQLIRGRLITPDVVIQN